MTSDLPIVSDLPAEKVNDLLALTQMLPDSLSGEEIICYFSIVLGSFIKDPAERVAFTTELRRREAQTALIQLIGLENFPEKKG